MTNSNGGLQDRQKHSLGKDRMLYCKNCMQEQELYSGAGHKPNQMNLHCVICTHFVTRLIRETPNHEWQLDTSVYG